MPCNMRADNCIVHRSAVLDAEIDRISNIWREGQGPWLCGEFCAVDIMFAPIATRFRTYGVELDGRAKSYAQQILDHPLTREWLDLAAGEPVVEKFEGPRRFTALA